MNNIVITGFDYNYFNIFGISWLASLRELGKYSGPVLVITFDNFSKNIVEKLSKENVFLTFCDKNKSRINTLKYFIDNILPEKNANYVYWDIDGYFEDCIEEVFSFSGNKLTFTNNKNTGFIIGNNIAWQEFKKYDGLLNLCSLQPSTDLPNYFPNLFNYVDDKWNYCEPARLLNSNKLNKFVHFSGAIKSVATEELLFSTKYPEIYKEWKEKFIHKPVLNKFLVK